MKLFQKIISYFNRNKKIEELENNIIDTKTKILNTIKTIEEKKAHYKSMDKRTSASKSLKLEIEIYQSNLNYFKEKLNENINQLNAINNN